MSTLKSGKSFSVPLFYFFLDRFQKMVHSNKWNYYPFSYLFYYIPVIPTIIVTPFQFPIKTVDLDFHIIQQEIENTKFNMSNKLKYTRNYNLQNSAFSGPLKTTYEAPLWSPWRRCFMMLFPQSLLRCCACTSFSFSVFDYQHTQVCVYITYSPIKGN